jgi:hypothetical protein
MKILPLAVLPVLTLVCCSKPEPKPAAKSETLETLINATNEKSLFPFAVGNSWNYALEITAEAADRPKRSMAGEIQYKVTKVVKESGDSVRATIAVLQDGVQKDEQDWSCDNKGIFQVSMKSSKVPFVSKQPVIRFPVKAQDAFRWEGSGITPVGKPGTMKYAFKNDGFQENVDTEMGSMGAVFMQSAGTFKANDGTDGQLVVNSWFSPGVGLIRYRQVVGVKGVNSSITLRLKSYNVKK